MNELHLDFSHFRDSCVFAYRREKHGIFTVKMNEFTYVFTYFELVLFELKYYLILTYSLSNSIYSYHSVIYLILFQFYSYSYSLYSLSLSISISILLYYTFFFSFHSISISIILFSISIYSIYLSFFFFRFYYTFFFFSFILFLFQPRYILNRLCY